MMMKKFSTRVLAITVMLIFLQRHLVASLSPIHQKTALFQFKQSLTIGTPTNCFSDSYSRVLYYSDGAYNSRGSYGIPSYPKTMNWSMSSDHCTWEGVTCDHQTGDVIGLDLSCSQLEGAILPNSPLFQLSRLHFLNLSHNDFFYNEFPQEFGSFAKGHIPTSIGKLSGLESLDLSSNQLEGEIPQQLTGIYWLARLNLSFNQLSGQIPNGPQFDTYDNDSYIGNFGLCGHPLSKKCENNYGIQDEEDGNDCYFCSGFTWEAVVIGYGCGVVPAFIIGYMMLLAGKPKWFARIIARELGLKIRRLEIKWR